MKLKPAVPVRVFALCCIVIAAVCAALLNSSAEAAAPPQSSVPSPDVRWGASEYEQLAEQLVANKISLPTLGDAKTKKLFERMVSAENIEFANDAARPLAQRVQDLLRISRSNAEFLKEYGSAISSGKRLGAEGARELAFSLRLSELMLKVMQEFLATLPRDKNYLSRLFGRAQMQLGVLQQVMGVIASLEETEIYSTGDRSLMLTALAATVPTLKSVCDADVRDELKRVLYSYRPLFGAPEDLKRIDSIEQELSAAK